jgi:hypothetical protein
MPNTKLQDDPPSHQSTAQDQAQHLQGLSVFPPRDKCLVAPRVIVTEHNYTITCPKCGKEVTQASYAKAYVTWWDHCL